MATFTKILAFNAASKAYNNVACDSNGYLNVNVVSGGGGGGGAGDASAANQLTQIQVAQDSNIALYDQMEVQADRLIYDLDIIANEIQDMSTTVSTRQLQTDSNLAVCSRLSTIVSAAEDTLLSVDGINTKLNALQLQSAKYTIEAVSRLAPENTPQFSVPPPGIEKSEGWYFKNLAVSQPSQLYFYSYLNSSLQVPARQFAYEIGSISMSYCVVRLLNINSGTGLVTMAIYSRPTGSGDSVPGFYKSRKVYTIPTGTKLTQGMRVMLWWGTEQPHLKLHPDVARIQLQLSSTTGPALSTEQLAFLTLQTDSTALAGNAEYVVSAAGFQFGGELIMDSTFTGESSSQASGSDATAANQTASNTAVCARLDASNVVLTYINTNLDQLTYSSSSNLLVYDALSNTTLGLVNYELTTLNGVFTDLISGDAQMYVKIDGSDDSIQILALDSTSLAPSAIYSVDNAAKVYVDNVPNVLLLAKNSVDNNVSLLVDVDERLLCNSVVVGEVSVVGDFYQASQPVEGTVSANVKSGDTPITFTQTGENQYSLDVHVNNSDIPVSGLFFQETQPVSIDKLSFTAGDELIVYDDLVFQEIEEMSGKITKCDTDNVGIVGTVPISSASPFDCHIYGSSDGTTWHYIKTNPTGVVSTNAIMETDANGALTSTSESGTETYNALDVRCRGTSTVSGTVAANLQSTVNGPLTSSLSGTGNSINSLDVAVKNSVSVQNVASTELAVKATQYGSFGNLANNIPSILPAGTTTGINVTDWSYFIGYYEDYYSGPFPTGSLRLQYSFDNITYYNFFNTQIFPSGTGTPRTGNIQKQDIPGIRYIRFLNDTNETMVNVTITLFGASL